MQQGRSSTSTSSSATAAMATTANGRLKIKHLGTIFQIYPNGLPDHGDWLRLEGLYIAKEKKKLKNSIFNIIANGVRGYNGDDYADEDNSERDSQKSPFKTAADLFKEPRK